MGLLGSSSCAKLIQLFEQGQGIRDGAAFVPDKGRDAVSEIDLIADGPGDDRGMIEVLRDQLAQLLPGVLTKRRRSVAGSRPASTGLPGVSRPRPRVRRGPRGREWAGHAGSG